MVDGSNFSKNGFSCILFAARPVGAQILTVCSSASSALTSPITIVVFPAPGPPVITETASLTEVLTAESCSSDNSRLSQVFSSERTKLLFDPIL